MPFIHERRWEQEIGSPGLAIVFLSWLCLSAAGASQKRDGKMTATLLHNSASGKKLERRRQQKTPSDFLGRGFVACFRLEFVDDVGGQRERILLLPGANAVEPVTRHAVVPATQRG